MRLIVITNNDIYTHIGRRVREERIRCRWTQERLAEKIDAHLSFIGQLERGVKKPSLATLKKIADSLGIRAGDLLDEVPPPPRHSTEKKLQDLFQGYSPKQQDFLYKSFRILAREFAKFPKK